MNIFIFKLSSFEILSNFTHINTITPHQLARTFDISNLYSCYHQINIICGFLKGNNKGELNFFLSLFKVGTISSYAYSSSLKPTISSLKHQLINYFNKINNHKQCFNY